MTEHDASRFAAPARPAHVDRRFLEPKNLIVASALVIALVALLACYPWRSSGADGQQVAGRALAAPSLPQDPWLQVQASIGPTQALPSPRLRAEPIAPSMASSLSDLTSYRIVATWSGVPRQTLAGRFLSATDLSSLPDGAIVVLGRAEGLLTEGLATDEAVHVLSRDGQPLALLPLAGELGVATRIDGGFGSTFFVLGQSERGNWRALEMKPDGTVVHRADLGPEGEVRDIAVNPNGTLYLVRGAVEGEPDRIEIYSPLGLELARIVPDELNPMGPSDPYTYALGKLDIDPDGRLYVIARASRSCPVPTATPTPRGLRPTATPTIRPSLGGLGKLALTGSRENMRIAAPTPNPPCSKEIVLVFSPAGTFQEEIANPHQSDIAAGPSGVYVSSSGPAYRRPPQRIYELRSQKPVFTYPYPDGLDVPLPVGASFMQLDVAADGRLHACVDLGDPFYRGAVTFGDPRERRPAGYRPTALGIYERPPLGGPVFPRRLDAADAVMILQAPHQRHGPDGWPNTAVDIEHDAEAVQRWSLAGTVGSQVVYHDQLLRDGATAGGEYHLVAPLVDLAYDGQDLYLLGNQVVWSRPDALPPLWHRHLPGTHLIAISADEGRVAVLNDAGRRVLVLDRNGNVRFDRPIAGDWSHRLASDLALHGSEVYLADEGRSSVLVRGLDGRDRGEWPTYAPPHRLSVGPEGDVYALCRGGYVLRYSPRGELRGWWRLPSRHQGISVTASDLAVADDSRVYVSFVGLAPPAGKAQGLERRGWALRAAGVWVFEPYEPEAPPTPLPPQPGCVVGGDKQARPRTVVLGDTVQLTLTAAGDCPGHHERQQLVLVVDTSWSMHDLFYPEAPAPGALRRAQEVMSALLGAIDPAVVEIGLVTFSSSARIEVPLPGDLGQVRSRLLTRRADGDTFMGTGITLAHQMLRGPKGKPDWKQTILVVTDGLFHDEPRQAIEAARADGIQVAAVIMTTEGLDEAARSRLEAVMGGVEDLFVDPLPETATQLINRVSTWVPNARLFETITIEDVLPENMAYLPGSAQPPATFDAARRALRWQLGTVAAADGLSLSYRVQPLQVGTWPTNLEARAQYVDGTGAQGQFEFPVPQVRVLAPPPTWTPTPVPTATDTATPTGEPSATRTPTATRSGQAGYQRFLPFVAVAPQCIRKLRHADVVLLMDASSSMRNLTRTGRSRHEAALEAARQFVSLLQLEGDSSGYDQVAVVAFSDRAWLGTPLTRDRGLVERVLAGLAAQIREGTRLDLALEEAATVLMARRSECLPVVVLLTDGWPTGVPTPAPSGGPEGTVLRAADRLKAGGAWIYTIGVGDPGDVWDWLMERLASSPDRYYFTPDAEDLARIYEEVLIDIVCVGPR